MITNITLNCFRAIRDLKIPSVTRLNVFVGKNNSGKTSVLEAISLAANGNNPANIPHSGLRRAGPAIPLQGRDGLNKELTDYFDAMIRGFFQNLVLGRDECPPSINLETEAGTYGFKMKTSDSGFISVTPGQNSVRRSSYHYTYSHPALNQKEKELEGERKHEGHIVASDSGFNIKAAEVCSHCLAAEFISGHVVPNIENLTKLVSKAFREGKLDEIVRRLRAIEPDLAGLAASSEFGVNTVIASFSDGRTGIPIQLMGDGFIRLLEIYAVIISSNASVLVVDEIDSGLHPSVMTSLWKELKSLLADRSKLQIFCSTHSDEIIEKIAEAYDPSSNDVRVFRITKNADNGVRNVTVRSLEQSLDLLETGYEIR